jgi:Fe-S cluster assembly ATP-binding protein
MNVGASGGERKKNELLHLQILNPRLCLLDEIEAGLDRDAVTTVGQMLTTLADNPDKSWIMVSHAPERLGIVPTHVHVIDQGRLIRSGGRELADQIQERGYETLV